MPKSRQNTFAFSKERLAQAIGLNTDGVSLQSLARSFDYKEEDLPRLRESVAELVDEGKVLPVRYDFYKSMRPLSDLVVARVSKSLTDRKTKIDLEIQGVEEDFPFTVSLSKKLIRKKFGTPTLRPGESLAVVLSRRNGTELVATHIIDKFKAGKPPTIVGNFDRRAGGKFSPYLHSIAHDFETYGQVPESPNPKTSFIAKIPSTLDPYEPALEIAEQKWDPDTGVPIASIIARKHGVTERHDRRATIEARLATRWKPDLSIRRDLTQEKILVIDPADARDHDDGIMIERTRDGGYRTLVVISDVPVFVRPDTHLDAQARNRAFTHYFPDDTFHMLPHKLVHHASLIEGRSKPVVYVEQFWDEEGKKLSGDNIGLGIISSQRQLTYGQMEDAVISDRSNVASYVELGDIMIERMRHEKITFDTDDKFHRYSYSQMLVASLMIEANTAIAEFLLFHNVPFLSRSHTGSHNLIAFNALKERLEGWGYDVPDDIADMNSESLRQIIAEAERRNDKRRVETEIRSNFLNQANYTTRPYSHFGLNRENYTHATSPIRRCADLLTLRGVHTALGDDEYGLSDSDIENLEATSRKLNYLQDASRRIARDVDRYYAIRDLQRLEGHTVRASFGKIEADRVEIILNQQYGLRKEMPISELPEGWRAASDGKSLIYNNTYGGRQDSPIRIRLADIRPHMGDWGFDMMTPATKKPAPAHLRSELRIA